MSDTTGADPARERARAPDSAAAAASAFFKPHATLPGQQPGRKNDITEVVPPLNHPWEDEDGWDDLQAYQRVRAHAGIQNTA
jgi:hypothetical protein